MELERRALQYLEDYFTQPLDLDPALAADWRGVIWFRTICDEPDVDADALTLKCKMYA
ncbi:MAG: hypothetical protein JKY20_03800 [Alphaproteobacteria bacterium]|nr:hypothetical protein [Alphaproteobacteria bacterium]